jgi:DNA polymerase-3 subunit delta
MIITLTGPNNYLLRKKVKELVFNFKKDNSSLAIERPAINNDQYNNIVSSLQSISLLTPSRLFVLDQPGSMELWQANFNEISSSIPDSSTIILLEPKLDKKTKYYKTLHNQTQFEEFDKLTDNQLRNWIIDYTKSKSAKISFSDANYLIELVGDDQNRIHNELDKLIAYELEITKNNIDLLVEPSVNTSVFKLLDSAFAGNYGQTTKIFNQLKLDKVAIPQIIGAITWQLHIFALIRSSKTNSVGEISKITKVKPFVVEKSMRAISKYSYIDISSLSRRLVDLSLSLVDYQIDQDEALINFLNSFYKN